MSTSAKQSAATKQNAVVSAESTTPAGRKRSALNALKHGIRSSLFVVPGLEREEDWKRHLAAVVESLEPATYLEAVLAQDVALLTWRLGRVARAEREAVSLLQETAAEDWADASRWNVARAPSDSPQGLRTEVAEKTQLLRDLENFPDLRKSDLIDGRAEAVLFALAGQIDLDLADPERFQPPPPLTNEALEDGEFEGWTPELFRRTAEAVATAAEVSLEELLSGARRTAIWAQKRAADALERAEIGVEHLQRARLLPEEKDLERFSRYEAHLRRSLAKTLQELRELQARRGSVTVIEAG